MHAGFSTGGCSGPSRTASRRGDDELCSGGCTGLAGQEWSLMSQGFKCLGFRGSERRTGKKGGAAAWMG